MKTERYRDEREKVRMKTERYNADKREMKIERWK
jgi:hypothetical protein